MKESDSQYLAVELEKSPQMSTLSGVKKRTLENVVILRVFCILSVIIFHVYGMTYDGEHLMDSTRSQYRDLYFVPINCWLINIAMPMFMLISGFLFYYLLDKGKYATWKEMLLTKSKRILLPYFIFGLIMIYTTGALTSPLELFKSYWHLWFLPTLMWCFILGYAIKNLIKNPWWYAIIFVISFVCMELPKFLPMIMGLHNLTKWFVWFILGGGLFIYKSYLDKILSHRAYSFLLLLVTTVFLIIYPPQIYGSGDFWFNLIQIFLLIAIWQIASQTDWSFLTRFWIIGTIDTCSFGLYIFHNWIALYLIGNFAKSTFHIEEFAADHLIIYPILFVLATFIISFGISLLLKSNRYTKNLI